LFRCVYEKKDRFIGQATVKLEVKNKKSQQKS